MTNIKPLGKLLLVEEIESSESKTASGLVLTASATEQDLKRAKVIDVGPGEVSSFNGTPVSYTHLTLPTKRIV